MQIGSIQDSIEITPESIIKMKAALDTAYSKMMAARIDREFMSKIPIQSPLGIFCQKYIIKTDEPITFEVFNEWCLENE